MTYLAGIVIWLSGFGCGIVLAIVVRTWKQMRGKVGV